MPSIQLSLISHRQTLSLSLSISHSLAVSLLLILCPVIMSHDDAMRGKHLARIGTAAAGVGFSDVGTSVLGPIEDDEEEDAPDL